MGDVAARWDALSGAGLGLRGASSRDRRVVGAPRIGSGLGLVCGTSGADPLTSNRHKFRAIGVVNFATLRRVDLVVVGHTYKWHRFRARRIPLTATLTATSQVGDIRLVPWHRSHRP